MTLPAIIQSIAGAIYLINAAWHRDRERCILGLVVIMAAIECL